MISLEDFVSEALTQLVKGIVKTQENIKDLNAEVCPLNHKTGGSISPSNKVIQDVQFEVAITATDSKEAKGGISVAFGLLNLGGQGSNAATNNSLSRITFSVPVSFPKQDSQKI